MGISRPGYLGTPLSAGRTPDEQGELCAAVLDALGLREAWVMAVSGDGPAAVAFALRHPGRCRGVVMISACSARLDVPLPFAWYVLKVAARIPGLWSAMARRAEADPEGAARHSIPDPELRAKTLRDPVAGPLMAALQRSTSDRIKLQIRGAENDAGETRKDLAFPLERLAPPVLAIHGTADSVVPFPRAREFAARVPGAELLTIDGGQHVTLFTHVHEVRERVARFMATHTRPAVG